MVRRMGRHKNAKVLFASWMCSVSPVGMSITVGLSLCCLGFNFDVVSCVCCGYRAWYPMGACHRPIWLSLATCRR